MKPINKEETLKKLSFALGDESIKESISLKLHGFANNLHGSIEVISKGDEKVRLKSIPIRGLNLKRSDGSPFTELKVFQKLEPGQRANIPIFFDLDPRTPPGVYEGEMVVGEDKRNFTINVVEKVGVAIFPDEFLIKNTPGEHVKKSIFVTNNGNVNVTIDKIHRAVLEEEIPYCGPIRAALKSGSEQGHDAVLDAFAKEMDKALNKIGSLVINNKSKPVEIPPGETKQVDLEIFIPKTLPSARKYIATAHILDKDITFIIQPM